MISSYSFYSNLEQRKKSSGFLRLIFKKVVVSAARVKRSETLDHDFEFEMKLRLEVVAWVIRSRQQKEGNAKQHVQLCGNGACADAYSRQLAAAGENGA